MSDSNKHPERLACDRLIACITDASWQLQSKDARNVSAATGVAARELLTTEGPVDYVVFVGGGPVGIIANGLEE